MANHELAAEVAADLPVTGSTEDERAAVRALFARPDQTGLAEGLATVADEQPERSKHAGKAPTWHEITLTEDERAEIRAWFRGVGQMTSDGHSIHQAITDQRPGRG